jgi:glycosyl transferase family 1
LQAEGRLAVLEQTVGAPGLYHRGDVYVYPSRLDGIGLTVPEALACGLPAIVPDEPPMNEFLDATSGRVVTVASRAEREDGYFWPMCLADVEHLTVQMQTYVDGVAGIAEAKRAARCYAEAHLNWYRNSADLPELLAKVKPLPAARKEKALQAARLFERNRAKQSARFWLSYHFPSAVGTVRSLYRAISKRSLSRER